MTDILPMSPQQAQLIINRTPRGRLGDQHRSNIKAVAKALECSMSRKAEPEPIPKEDAEAMRAIEGSNRGQEGGYS